MPQVFIALAVSLLLLWSLWPRFVSWTVQNAADGNVAEKIRNRIGPILIVTAGVAATLLAAVFYQADDKTPWSEPEPAVTALGVVAGVVFVYSRLFPPAFSASFYRVVDFSTGDWQPAKLEELDIGLGHEWPIFLEVQNTGVAPWNNYRVTVAFRGGFHLWSNPRPSVGASYSWAWPTQFRPTGRFQDFLQVQAGNTLAVAESQTLRFLVSPPLEAGRYKVDVSVVADGRLSESRRVLWVNVKEGLNPPATS